MRTGATTGPACEPCRCSLVRFLVRVCENDSVHLLPRRLEPLATERVAMAVLYVCATLSATVRGGRNEHMVALVGSAWETVGGGTEKHEVESACTKAMGRCKCKKNAWWDPV